MGREITQADFTAAEFKQFQTRLAEETALLLRWLDAGRVQEVTGTCGLELEACLVDQQFRPAADNARFIEGLNNPLIVPELARFNFEINTPPFPPEAGLFGALEGSLQDQWQACRQQAERMGLNIVQTGILPTLQDTDLTMANVSGLQRYIALNQQILKGRRYHPLAIQLDGDHDSLSLTHNDVMMESATTSLQIHLQVAPRDAVRFYNASILASAAMVACCANSPLLYGRELWRETRIPLFEQAVAMPAFTDAQGNSVNRVYFGSAYLRDSIAEVFRENLDRFPVLLPMLYPDDAEPLTHLQIHNGTIWRWNRPLLHVGKDGIVQLRIEHRAIAAGPTITDDIANIAFYYGLVHALASQPRPPEHRLAFELARDNFYTAARNGLDAEIGWLDGKRHNIRTLLLAELIPAAKATLLQLGFCASEVNYYLDDVIQARVHSRQNGAQWQLDCFRRHNGDTRALLAEYHDNQTRGPVHLWP